MKLNFKKISAIITSTLMVGMTMGGALAANYPAPFIENGAANVAIVYSSNPAVNALDVAYAGNIQTDLQQKLGTGSGTTGTTTASGGDAVLIEKTSTKWELGNKLLQIRSSALDDNDMANLLASGTFIDDDNDEFDYKQSITLANLTLTQFDDDDYVRDTPSIGIKISDGGSVLNYTLDLTEEPYFQDLETSSIPIMGREYYVLDVTADNNSITLLDSAEEVLLAEGDTTTVTLNDVSYEVSISYLGSTSVKFIVNGAAPTNSLTAGATSPLGGGVYLGVKEVLYSEKETGISKVEFSIGKGKLLLTDGDEVQINDEDVDNLVSLVTNNSDGKKLSEITLQWTADGDLFVADGSEAIMPGFSNVKLSYGGMVFPTEETIVLKADGDDNFMLQNFPLKGTTETIYLFYSNGTNFTEVGKDGNNRLATRMVDANTLDFVVGTDDYAVISYKSGDDAESYLIRAANLDDTLKGVLNTTDIEYKVGSTWEVLDTDVGQGETVSVGSVEFTVDTISSETLKTVRLSASTDNSFTTLYSKEGLEVLLPWINETAVTVNDSAADGQTAAEACANATVITPRKGQIGYNRTVTYNATGGNWATPLNTTNCFYQNATFKLGFVEEDKNDAIALGGYINVSLGLDTDSEVTISSYTNGDTNGDAIAAAELGDTEVYIDYVSSALATKILDDQGGDHELMTLVYHGGESYAKVYVTDVSTIVTTTDGTPGTATPLGDVLITDAEVGSAGAKNLIIIGGSCINSAAATLVGGQLCGSAWTETTGIGTGQYLIKGYSGAATKGLTTKLALLVAGYEYTDTVNAVKYLKSKTVNTSLAYKGTTSESAALDISTP